MVSARMVCLLPPVLVCLIFTQKAAASQGQDNRFILFDVNPGEGFNLRRDVFMRIAVFVKKLNDKGSDKFTLILPPWGRLYHWQSHELGEQIKIPWTRFFDVQSIARYVPVIDLQDFIDTEGPVIDKVLYLQNYKEGFKSGEFVEKFDFRDCNDRPVYRRLEGEPNFHGWFWGYGDQMSAKDFACLSVQGSTSVISGLVSNMTATSILLDRAETLLHDWFGDEEYWSVRRSMVFAEDLVREADDFRREHLDSEDGQDDTVRTAKWEDYKPKRSASRGGNYMCVHLRRKDYVYSRKDQIPNLQNAAEQIRRKLTARDLKKLFVATDAPEEEFSQLKSALNEFQVERFKPDTRALKKYKDGGVAIIDQIICSHARYFLGSPESTYTFRIQEEREIMGFKSDNTFDMLCPDGKFDCQKGSVWKIVYPNKRDEL